MYVNFPTLLAVPFICCCEPVHFPYVVCVAVGGHLITVLRRMPMACREEGIAHPFTASQCARSTETQKYGEAEDDGRPHNTRAA